MNLQGHSIRPASLSSALQHLCASSLINIRLLSWLKGMSTSQTAKTNKSTKNSRDMDPTLPQLFTVGAAFSGFYRHVPGAWSRQTDKVRMGQHGPSDKMDKTRGERCPAITGVNKRRSGGHSRHRYGRLTGAVTALTL